MVTLKHTCKIVVGGEAGGGDNVGEGVLGAGGEAGGATEAFFGVISSTAFSTNRVISSTGG